MYTIINETKIEVISTQNDLNVLNITMKSGELGMQGLYDLFKDNNISTITIKEHNPLTEEEDTINIFNGYTKIDSYFFIPTENNYSITLLKVDPNTFQGQLEQMQSEIEKTNTTIQETDDKIVSIEQRQDLTEQAVQDLILANMSMGIMKGGE